MGDDIYVVTGYRELMALAHDPTDQLRHQPQPAAGRARGCGPSRQLEPTTCEAYGRDRSIIVSDPPDHDRARRQVMRHFGPPHSPDLIPSMEPDIQRLCNELLDNVKAKGKTRLDVVDDYAYPVPVAVICKILGVPLKDEPMFHAWIFDFMAGVGLGPGGSHRRRPGPRGRRAERAPPRSMQYLAELIERYRREPGEGLLSKLVNDDGPDGPMSPKEAVANAMLLLVAGHDSTVNTISHCVLTLLRNPGSFELAAPPTRTDSPGHRGGAAAAVGGAVLSQPQRHRRHRDRRHGHPRRVRRCT